MLLYFMAVTTVKMATRGAETCCQSVLACPLIRFFASDLKVINLKFRFLSAALLRAHLPGCDALSLDERFPTFRRDRGAFIFKCQAVQE